MAKKHLPKARKRMKSKKAFKLKLKPQTVYSIVQITFFSLAALILISFSGQGTILSGLKRILMSRLGWASIFLPFIFLIFGLIVSKFRFFLSQPNVVIGTLLFFVSITSLTKSGSWGLASWEGMAELVTHPGAFIIFFGSSVVGLVVLFNTSLDQVLGFFVSFWEKYLFRKKPQLKGKISGGMPVTEKKGFSLFGKKGFGFAKKIEPKVNEGGSNQSSDNKNMPKSLPSEPLTQKLVSNIPGEEIVWKYPDISLFSNSPAGKADRGDIKNNAAVIEETLDSFGIEAQVVEVNLGPAVTQYALSVAMGTKLSKITALERDLALALAAPTGTIRIEAPIPGRNLVGIELPNKAPEFVPMRKMMDSDEMRGVKSKIAVSLGLDVTGRPIISDLARMPHVLIAGQTGSGKSVCVNTFLTTLLYRTSPAELKLILVDPKRVELTNYNNIPHLLTPVIVEPPKVVSALRWLMSEMDRRYKLFAEAGARNIDSFNEMSGFQALPYIVLFIDELADIMLFAPVEVEDAITRIAQMSRATGIHMVLATQRPSVDVITGLIKANIPCRVAFAVSSQIDSRVILDTQGAEKLLGKGDMLYLPPEQAKPMRIQGAFVSDSEINNLVSFLKGQGVGPQYTEEVTSMTKSGAPAVAGVEGDADEFFTKAAEIVCEYDRASASLLQRRLSIGYSRAARIIDQLEAAGIIGPADGSKPREVLVSNPSEALSQSSQAN